MYISTPIYNIHTYNKESNILCYHDYSNIILYFYGRNFVHGYIIHNYSIPPLHRGLLYLLGKRNKFRRFREYVISILGKKFVKCGV